VPRVRLQNIERRCNVESLLPMTRFLAWLRWFVAGPQQNIELAAEVGKSLHEIEKRISRLEEAGALITKMHAEMGDVRAAQRQLQDLQKELEKPELVRPRTASNFRRLVEGDNAA